MGCEGCRFAQLNKKRMIECRAPREVSFKAKSTRDSNKYLVTAALTFGSGRPPYCDYPTDSPGYQQPNQGDCSKAQTAISFERLMPHGTYLVEGRSEAEAIANFRNSPPDCR